MGQLNIRIDDELLKSFEAWCKKHGIKKSTVIRLFLRELVDGKLKIAIIKEEEREKDEG